MRASRMCILAAVTFAAVISPNISMAQNQCDIIITKGLREYDISSDSSSYLNNVFSQYCHSTGEANTSGFNAGLDAVVKAIPVKFSLGSSDTKTSISNFCKIYKDSTEYNRDKNSYKETIVRRAYNSYDNCVQLSQLGYFATHDIISPAKTQVLLRAGVGRPIEITGLDTSKNIKCVGSVAGKEIEFNVSSNVKDNNAIGIFCTRESYKTAADVTVYDEGSVAINMTGHKYNFYLPRSEILPESVASQVQESIIQVKDTIDVHEKVNSSARLQVQTIISNASQPNADGPTAGNMVWNSNSAACPSGQYMVGVKLRWTGTCNNQCNGDGGILGGMTILCRKM